MPQEPQYEIRWAVIGTQFTFAREGQARAFALPGQAVVKTRRLLPDPDATLEFLLGTSDPASE